MNRNEDLPKAQSGVAAKFRRQLATDKLLFALSGGRRYFLALLFGLAAASGMPPIYFLPGLIFGFSGLLLLLQTDGRRGIFISIWLFSFGYFLAGLYWVANALLVDATKFGWLWPFAVLLLPTVLAFFPAAIITYLAWLFRHRTLDALGWMLVLVLGWSLAEYLRGILFTGFPWHAVGYAWTFSDAGMQIYALVGVPLAGFLTVAAAAAPALILAPRSIINWRFWIPITLILSLVVAVLIYGNVRLAMRPPLAFVPEIRLRIVQPNIPQKDKWRGDLLDQHLLNLLQLSSAPGFNMITHLIWPETAPPFNFLGDHERRRLVASAAPKNGRLITGAVYVQQHSGQRQVRNAIISVRRGGNLEKIYNKVHLVPFGEYLPFRSTLQRFGLDKIVAGLGDFVPGKAPKLLHIPGLPSFRPLICYEVIFPGEVRSPARPSWILNVTNDAWYGDSAGPRQHFQIARVRAVELGVPLVRAANTGISAVVGPYGRVLAKRDLLERGVVDYALPEKIAPTVYARIADIGFFVIIAIGIFVLFFKYLGPKSQDQPLDKP